MAAPRSTYIVRKDERLSHDGALYEAGDALELTSEEAEAIPRRVIAPANELVEDDLATLTKAELARVAKDMGLDTNPRETKGALIERIKEARTAG